ncbi:MAG: tetratricopeptide repeat protein [Thermodesulfobacteriota bacterium]
MTSRHWQLIACLVLVLVTLAAFGRVVNHQFIQFDDLYYLTENPGVREGVTLKSLSWAMTTTRAGNWVPLTWLSHLLDVQIFGLRPGGHHLTSLVFHIANTLLLFLWLLRATRSLGPAFLAAALFAWHPLHVEPVAWAAARKDVLSTFFWLLTLWAYLRYGERPGWGRYALVLLCFLLGLLAKPMLVTLPLVLLLLDYWPLGRWGSRGIAPRTLILEKLPLLVLAALFGLVTLHAQKAVGAMAPLGEISLGGRVATALVAYVWYPLKMFWPTGLAVLYPHPVDALPLWQAVFAGVILALVSILVVWRARRYPYLLVGWLWYLGTLLPVIGLVQVGNQAWADRYTYVPLIGLFIMAAWGARDLTAGLPGARIIRPLGAGIMLTALLILTMHQVSLWRDSVTLFEYTLAVTADNFVIHHDLGVALAARGQRDQAAPHFFEALRLNPYNARAQNQRGEDLVAQGKIAEGIARFRAAIKLKPDFVAAYNNLGLAYARQGEMDQALAMFQKTIALDPNFALGYKNLGLVLACQGKKQEARKMLEKAVRINPHDQEGKNILQEFENQEID